MNPIISRVLNASQSAHEIRELKNLDFVIRQQTARCQAAVKRPLHLSAWLFACHVYTHFERHNSPPFTGSDDQPAPVGHQFLSRPLSALFWVGYSYSVLIVFAVAFEVWMLRCLTHFFKFAG